MRRKRTFGILAVILMVLSALPPAGSADYESKTELDAPDWMFIGFESDPAEENKTEELLRGGSSLSTQSVNVTIVKKGSSSRESGEVTFPYEKWNWTIDKCYRTSYGLRFYGVYFEDEKILYDYRVPWVEFERTRYDLTEARSDGTPTLYIWDSLKVFKVEVSYSFQAGNVAVEVREYCYFWEDGSFDPWVYVDCEPNELDIRVGQRFDFDLGGAGDDNADYYTDSGWDLVEEEDDHPDGGNPEDDNVQWRLYDTDVFGTGYINDQIVNIIPYHADDSKLWIVRYHGNQIGGDPSSYDNNEATGLYSGATYDHFIGYDLVAWYVSDYEDTMWCNPGPWTEVGV